MNFSSDDRLNEKLSDWHSLLDEMKPLEEEYLRKETEVDYIYSSLFLKVPVGPVAEKEAIVLSSPEFAEFKRGVALTKAKYLDCKRRLELKIKSFEAEYLTMKVEAEAIKKHR